MSKRLVRFLLALIAILAVALPAAADPGSDLTAANQLVLKAKVAAAAGDAKAAKASYDEFAKTWFEIEGGIHDTSLEAYKAIEEEMGAVSFAFMQNPVDLAKVTAAMDRLAAANQKFIDGGFAPDGGAKPQASTDDLAGVLKLLDEAAEKAQAKDAAGAAAAINEFREHWLDVEGVVLTQSAKIYADSERDMVTAAALLASNPPKLDEALTLINQMREYLAPIASKSSYTAFDAATIILREGLEALLVLVALLGFLKKGGQSDKSIWVWGGVGAGLLVSVALAVAVKLIFGTGAFGNNNFLIAGGTGLFAAVMLIWVSYWLHSKSSVQGWNSYIKEQSTKALATGNLLSLATLAFLAVFREGTETVLFYVGMASSIAFRDLFLGLGSGLLILVVLAVAILKIGLRIPIRPFFQVSAILVFYLAFKFTGMGIHGFQLAGLLPATVIPGLPSIDFLAFYPNWQSAVPQLLLLVGALATVIAGRRPKVATPATTH
jgi:high-affinity iron transporter